MTHHPFLCSFAKSADRIDRCHDDWQPSGQICQISEETMSANGEGSLVAVIVHCSV